MEKMNDSNIITNNHDREDNGLPLKHTPLKLDPNTMNNANYLNVGDSNTDLKDLIPSPSFAELERCISNPLVRGYSNVSVSSDDGAHFVPYGRNHEEIQSTFGFPDSMARDNNNNNNNNNNNVTADLNAFNPGNAGMPHNMSFERLAPLPDIDSDQSAQQNTRPLTADNIENMENIENFESQSSNGRDNDQEIYENKMAFVINDEDDAIETEIMHEFNANDTGQMNMNTQNTQKNIDEVKLDALANPFVPNMGDMGDMGNMAGIYVPPNRNRHVMQFPLLDAMNNVNINVTQAHLQPQMQFVPHLQPPTQLMQAQLIAQHNQRIVMNNNKQKHGIDYAAERQNYMNATMVSDVDVSPNQSPNYNVNSCNKERRNNTQQTANNNTNNRKSTVANMEITDIIKLNLSLTELMNEGMICKFMKHQNGSRYIQEKLKNASNSMITCILNDIILQNQVLSLSEDIFGNYVIQIFFENGNKNHHDLLTNNLLKKNVYRLSRSFYGCRVIQTAFDYIGRNDAISLIEELKRETEKEKEVNLIHECIICPNANHVIQKIISLNLQIDNIQFIIDCIDENICFYSSHIFRCRIVQNILNYYGNMDDKKMLYEMISKDNLLHLCQSQYGNYVIQHILALQLDDDSCMDIKHTVIKNVFDNVLFLSKNKYGSNVVERCLIQCSDQERGYLVNQICGGNNCKQQNKENAHKGGSLNVMVRHKYANYVIQKLLQHCNAKQQNKLIWNIEKNIPNLRSLNYGKHIMDRIKRIKMNKNNNHGGQSNQYKQYY